MKVYERLAHAFAQEGITSVFGLMGDGNMYWMEELDKLGVKLYEVRHEGFGCGMADGWARATRTPGICTATQGPGVSQLATALLTASRGGQPIVAFVGEHPTNDDEYVQRLDHSRFAAACESGFVRAAIPANMDAAVRKAFYMAKTESRPVLLSVPMDVQELSFDYKEAYEPSTSLITTQMITPDPAKLQQAADMIAASKKPIIIVGRGAKWANAGDAVLKLAQRIGALIATTSTAKTWLAEDEFHVGLSGQFATYTAIQLFKEVDCVIAVGASLNRFTTVRGKLYPKARFIQIDSKPSIMTGTGKAADCYVQSDARLGTEALEILLAKQSMKSTGFRTAEVKKKLVNHFVDRAEFPLEDGCVDPREVCITLDQIIPNDINLVMGSGASTGFTHMNFNRPRPMVFGGHFYGCIGQMLPAALGIVVATDYKPTLLVDGDASTMMHLADFEAAVRNNMPLLVVVLNDQALGTEYHKMVSGKHNAELAVLSTPDIGAVSKALGGRGYLARSIDELKAAAKEWLAKPGPMIVDVRISRNVLTVPNQRMLYGRDA